MRPKLSQPNTIGSSLHNYHSSRITQQEREKLGYWRERYQAKLRMKLFKKNVFGEHYNHEHVRLNNQKKFLIQQQKNTQIQRANRILLQKIKRIANRSVPKQMNRIRTQNSTNMTKPLRYNSNNQIHFDSQLLKNQRNMSLLQMQNKMNKNKNITKGFTPQNKRIYTDHQNQEIQDNKITLYRGKRKFDGKEFSFSIFIQNQKYNLLSQNAKTQQKIQMPVKSYQTLLKTSLDNKHSNIFNFLRINSQGILQIVGVKKLIKDVIQKMELKLPINQAQIQTQLLRSPNVSPLN